MSNFTTSVVFTYFLLGNLSTPLGFLTAVSPAHSPKSVTLRFLGAHADHVAVGEEIFSLSEGEVTLPASLFGEKTAVSPLSFSTGARYLCPAVLKRSEGNGESYALVANTSGEDALLSLSRDTDAISRALDLLEEKVTSLSRAVCPHPFRLGGTTHEA